MTKNEKKLMAKYLEHINFEKLQTVKFPKIVVIGFLGSIGSGKSTISKLLSNRLNIPILSNDSVRTFLNKNGAPGGTPRQSAVLAISGEQMKLFVKRGISYIFDSDLTLTYKKDTEWISSLGAHLFLIKVTCPKNIILERIGKRSVDEGLFVANSQHYFDREKLRQKVQLDPEDIFFTIDTAKDLPDQINKLATRIVSYINN